MVKLADRITNLQKPPGFWNKKKRISYLEEARMIGEMLVHKNKYLCDRLNRKITDYEKYV